MKKQIKYWYFFVKLVIVCIIQYKRALMHIESWDSFEYSHQFLESSHQNIIVATLAAVIEVKIYETQQTLRYLLLLQKNLLLHYCITVVLIKLPLGP